MMKDITLETKISEILNERPELEHTLFELSPAFAKLQSPILRRTVARVTSVKQAASIAGIDASHMLTMLRKAAGLEPLVKKEETPEASSLLEEPCPEWFHEESVKIKFDASGVLEEGNVPMGRIIEESKNLLPGEIYLFTTPFVPAPIIEILHNKNIMVWSRRKDDIIENFVVKY